MGLTNTGSSKYHEVETSVHYNFRDSDQLNASYIWSHARGDLNNLSSIMIPFDAPVIRPDVYGILASDIPNRFDRLGNFLPALEAYVQSAGRCSLWLPLLPDRCHAAICRHAERPALPGVFLTRPQGLSRISDTRSWKGKNGKGHHFRLGAYSLNITNHGNFSTVYNNVASPDFGKFVGLLYRHEGMTLDFVD